MKLATIVQIPGVRYEHWEVVDGRLAREVGSTYRTFEGTMRTREYLCDNELVCESDGFDLDWVHKALVTHWCKLEEAESHGFVKLA